MDTDNEQQDDGPISPEFQVEGLGEHDTHCLCMTRSDCE